MEFIEGNYELKELATLEGHSDRVWCVSWNPTTAASDSDPELLASCSGDKTVRIWHRSPNSKTWYCKEVLEETHTGTVRSCAWSPSGNHLATASFDGTVAIWEMNGGEFQCISTLEGHENEVKSVSWNASGTLLATCGRDKTVWIWEVLPGNEFECASVLQGHTQDVKMVKFHPSHDLLFSCSYDNTIKLWGEDSDCDWHCVQTLNEPANGHTSTVWGLACNREGDKLVSCSDDLTLKIWKGNMESEEEYRSWAHQCTLSGYHDRTVFSIHWSRDDIIASGGGDDAICLFVAGKDDLVEGSSFKLLLKHEKAHNMDINCVQWSPTGRKLLASCSDDGSIKIWELVVKA